MSPCLQLFRESGGLFASSPCTGSGFTFTVSGTLDETGLWTILVVDGGTTQNVGPYNLVVDRLSPPPPTAEPLDYGATITGEINPIGDADLFISGGTLGSTVAIQTAKLSGSVRPCIYLYDPDAALVASDCHHPGTQLRHHDHAPEGGHAYRLCRRSGQQRARHLLPDTAVHLRRLPEPAHAGDHSGPRGHSEPRAVGQHRVTQRHRRRFLQPSLDVCVDRVLPTGPRIERLVQQRERSESDLDGARESDRDRAGLHDSGDGDLRSRADRGGLVRAGGAPGPSPGHHGHTPGAGLRQCPRRHHVGSQARHDQERRDDGRPHHQYHHAHGHTVPEGLGRLFEQDAATRRLLHSVGPLQARVRSGRSRRCSRSRPTIPIPARIRRRWR